MTLKEILAERRRKQAESAIVNVVTPDEDEFETDDLRECRRKEMIRLGLAFEDDYSIF